MVRVILCSLLRHGKLLGSRSTAQLEFSTSSRDREGAQPQNRWTIRAHARHILPHWRSTAAQGHSRGSTRQAKGTSVNSASAPVAEGPPGSDPPAINQEAPAAVCSRAEAHSSCPEQGVATTNFVREARLRAAGEKE